MIPKERITVLADANAVATHAAEAIATAAWDAVHRRGEFLLAVSGGSTPLAMFDALAELDVPWARVHLFQVDERVAPAGDAARNLAGLEAHLISRIGLPADQLHAMPVEAVDRVNAAALYADTLHRVTGTPPMLDLIHLGLGADGHTASLVPGDAALEATEDVVVTAPYQGHRRMTLTYPVLARARRLLWVVTGEGKGEALDRLVWGDPGIPAGRVAAERAEVIADRAAG
ncbi:MAG TPA: 6-phosphogluconolactonase [Gemmatimonadales bacterium]|nr:6-phosphogluconolactonase [Gemmatimonadales bacterium]